MTLRLNGSTSGYTEIDAPAVAGSNTLVLPTGNGSANQFLKNGSTAGSLGWSSLVEDSSNRLLVGTSTSFASTAVLQVNTYQNGAAAVGFATKPSTNANYDPADFYNTFGTLVGYISCTSSATSYSTSSDYRLKENVEPITEATDRILQLNPSRFNFIVDPDKIVDGFIAHEVQAIVPEAITGEKDAVDDDGNPKYQGIDQSKLVPLLTAALQEAVAEIKALKDRVTALESA